MQRRQVLAGLALAGVSASTQAGKDMTSRRMFDERLREIVERHRLMGASVLLVRGGELSHEAQHGLKRLALPGQDLAPVLDARTLFRVASISKLVVAVAAMRLVEQGLLDLDEDLGRYLDFSPRHPNFQAQRLSARMLLSHRASLSDGAGYGASDGVSVRKRLASPKAWLPAMPGSRFGYSNLGFVLLGTVMEAASGQRFDLLMEELLLKPLGITGGYNAARLAPEQLEQVATLYRKRIDTAQGEQWLPDGPWQAQADDFLAQPPTATALLGYRPGSNAAQFSPQGGLRISLRDLSKLMRMLIDQGRWQGQALLKPASVAQLLTEQWRYDPQQPNGDSLGDLFQSWALGMQHFIDRSAPGSGDRLRGTGGLQAHGHLGFAYGLQAGFFFNAAQRWGMIYAINGVSFDPDRHKGRYSSFSIWEEALLDLMCADLP